MKGRVPNILGTLGRQPLAVVGMIVGGCIFGAVGAVAGLAVGLVSYPPTAWAATFELGYPAALLGGTAGALVGAGLDARRRCFSRRP